ncbi:sulfatase, partial [Candidatus Pacearchaeota archaeon]|nr:sulfatase [Candidatus Pacearchaeota archaeon]
MIFVIGAPDSGLIEGKEVEDSLIDVHYEKSTLFMFCVFAICLSAAAGIGAKNIPYDKVSSRDGHNVMCDEQELSVIVITISSLRADHVSCMGYFRGTTPNFDTFATEHILLTHAFSTSSWQMPAHGSLFTSLFPSIHGATDISKNLAEEHITLAEILNDSGYYSVGFCCNPRLTVEKGFGQGFDLYDDYSVTMLLEALSLDDSDSININRQRTNDLINDAAIRWLENNRSWPFFMFLHYYDNHWDYLPPKPYDKMFDPDYAGSLDGTDISREPLHSNPPAEEDVAHMIALYDGQVRQTDEDLGEMLDYLDQSGLMEQTIVIILGDHGEQFYEHGNTSH